MTIDRSTLCDAICRHVHIKRMNPTRKLLSKREAEHIFKRLIQDEQEIERLKARVKSLMREKG